MSGVRPYFVTKVPKIHVFPYINKTHKYPKSQILHTKVAKYPTPSIYPKNPRQPKEVWMQWTQERRRCRRVQRGTPCGMRQLVLRRRRCPVRWRLSQQQLQVQMDLRGLPWWWWVVVRFSNPLTTSWQLGILTSRKPAYSQIFINRRPCCTTYS